MNKGDSKKHCGPPVKVGAYRAQVINGVWLKSDLQLELFVETIAKDAYCCAQQGKRKTLQRRDLDNAIEAVDEFAFLEGEFIVSTNHSPADR
ncbi:DNA polymerase epsilon subunit 4-like protein [Cricetulus griseus]|nr:DNA polymerase epsilon subunit 4-like protein [Cricetulus griseus]